MISTPKPVRIRVHMDQLNNDVIIISSPMRFGRGGNARLARVAVNHQMAIKGKSVCNPRAKIIVRLWERS